MYKLLGNALMSNEYNAHFESLATKLHDDNPHVQVLAHLIMHALINQLSGEHQIDAAYKTLKVISHEQILNIQSLPEVTDELLQVSLKFSPALNMRLNRFSRDLTGKI